MASAQGSLNGQSGDPLTGASTNQSVSTRILGTGSYLPERRLSNHDLEGMVDTSDEWITERTGIRYRRIAAPDESTTDLAFKASLRALEAAGLEPRDIDGIIFATVTAERIMPAAACALQAKLGCRSVMAFDVSAACSGFLYAMNVADSLIKTSGFRRILVVGAETLSRIMNYADRETCILFGDGAGAIIVGRADETSSSRLLSFHLGADGAAGDHLTLDGVTADRLSARLGLVAAVPAPLNEATNRPDGPYVQMKGREIFRCAVKEMSERCREAFAANRTEVGEVDWFIPHQANIRIVEAVGRQIEIDPARVIMNLDQVGNTSSASIPLALDAAVRDGRIKRGQRVLLAAFGAGLTSASALINY